MGVVEQLAGVGGGGRLLGLLGTFCVLADFLGPFYFCTGVRSRPTMHLLYFGLGGDPEQRLLSIK